MLRISGAGAYLTLFSVGLAGSMWGTTSQPSIAAFMNKLLIAIVPFVEMARGSTTTVACCDRLTCFEYRHQGLSFHSTSAFVQNR